MRVHPSTREPLTNPITHGHTRSVPATALAFLTATSRRGRMHSAPHGHHRASPAPGLPLEQRPPNSRPSRACGCCPRGPTVHARWVRDEGGSSAHITLLSARSSSTTSHAPLRSTTSDPITAGFDSSRNRLTCVTRQSTRRCDCCSNHAATTGWWTCPPHVAASQTPTSSRITDRHTFRHPQPRAPPRCPRSSR